MSPSCVKTLPRSPIASKRNIPLFPKAAWVLPDTSGNKLIGPALDQVLIPTVTYKGGIFMKRTTQDSCPLVIKSNIT